MLFSEHLVKPLAVATVAGLLLGAVIAACGIFLLWFILSTTSETAIRAALHRKPRAHQEIATNLLFFVLLALRYSVIVESFRAGTAQLRQPRPG